jgi:hypothetical protein
MAMRENAHNLCPNTRPRISAVANRAEPRGGCDERSGASTQVAHRVPRER